MADFELVGHAIETPLVNAAGSINGLNQERILCEVETLAATAIGAITVGSITVLGQAGNEAKFGGPTYHHDKQTGSTYNSMGLPNIGLVAAKKLMPEITARAHAKGKPVIVSVSPVEATTETGDTYSQIIRLVYELQLAGADIIEVDTSCPSFVTEGGDLKPILSYDLEGMGELVAKLAPWTGTLNSKVGVKLPPYMTDQEKQIMPELAKLFKEKRVFGFIVTANSVPNKVARDEAGRPILSVPGGTGGMSGPATKGIGREQLRIWKDLIGDDIDIISTLGVDSGIELAVRRDLGATAAGGVTFLWESKDWGKAVTDLIEKWTGAQEQQA